MWLPIMSSTMCCVAADQQLTWNATNVFSKTISIKNNFRIRHLFQKKNFKQMKFRSPNYKVFTYEKNMTCYKRQ